MLLPSNTTHVLQPLDVGVYGPLKQAWKKILTQHKFSTRASNIGKEDFPTLLAQLWETRFKSSHLVGGFRETGLFPLNYSAIPPWKISPCSITTPSEHKVSKCTCFRESNADTTPSVPDWCHKTKRRREETTTQTKNDNGEALTSDEVLEKLEMQEREKSTKRKKGRATAQKSNKKKEEIIEDEEHCQACGTAFQEGEEDACLGCDSCLRWVHCYCVGFDVTPDTDSKWLCFHCKWGKIQTGHTLRFLCTHVLFTQVLLTRFIICTHASSLDTVTTIFMYTCTSLDSFHMIV